MSDTSASDPYDVTTDGKPDIAKMRRVLREFEKAERLKRLAQGRGKPKTRAETAIWLKGIEKRFGLGGDDDA